MDRDASTRPREWPHLVIACALAGLVHLGSLRVPFLFDDFETVVHNPSLVHPENFVWVLIYEPFRPAVNVTHALERLLWGEGPFGYHLDNLALHVASVGLLFALAARLAEDAGLGPARAPIAFATASLHAVHPLHVATVSYVSARAEVLCAAFFLSGCLVLRAALDSRRARHVVLGLLCLTLAGLSKETAALFPLVLLAWDRILFPARPRRGAWLWGYVALGAVAVTAIGYRLLRFEAAEPLVGASLAWRYLFTQFTVIPRYVALLLAPVSLSPVHDVPWVDRPTDYRALAGLTALLALALLLLRQRRVRPLPVFGMSWFLLLLAPTSSIIPLSEWMSERRLYLSGCGFFLALAGLGSEVARGMASMTPRLAALPRALLASLLTILAVATVARTRLWSDPLSLWSDAARKAPGSFPARFWLAEARREAGDCPGAVPEYLAAVRLIPQAPEPYVKIRPCLSSARGSLAELESLGRMERGCPEAATTLVLVGMARGDRRDAGRDLKAALAVPGMPETELLVLLQAARELGDPGAIDAACRALRAKSPAPQPCAP